MATAESKPAYYYSVQDSPLQPAPAADGIFTPAQWATFLAIADTIVPSVRPAGSSGPSSSSSSSEDALLDDAEFTHTKTLLQFGSTSAAAADNATRYLAERASATTDFKESICRTMGLYVPSDQRRGLSLVLTGLNNAAVSLLLTGSAAPFQTHPLRVREAILHGWQTSYLAPVRAFYRAMVALCGKTWLSLSPTLPPVLGFPRVPIHAKPPTVTERQHQHTFLQFPPPAAADRSDTHAATATAAADDPETIEADVVIVGSGVGAGVTAKNLSEAGHRVVVVEKSYYFPESHFPMDAKQGPIHLFATGGAQMTDDSSVGILSGSTWGGGGTVNWSASLQTQAMVRREWAEAAGGLPFFTSAAFQRALDRVCELMGVSTDHVEHNYGNAMLLEGARRLGYAAKPVPQNTGNQAHVCGGYCAFGCVSAVKQSPCVKTLADAARAGATFIEGMHVDKVLFDEDETKNKVATGVSGTWTSRDAHGATSGEPLVRRRKVIIKAKKVVVSCGALESPLLLRRSGLTNPNIGRNLYLHPVILIAAVFPHDTSPWEGGILTSVVTEFESADAAHAHGAKIETVAMQPALFLPLFPWHSGSDFKQFAAHMRQAAGLISLCRDRDPGRVYPDPVDGRCRVRYTPSAFDRQHVLDGVVAAAKMAYVSGAREIRTTASGIPPFIRPETEALDTDTSERSSDADADADEDGINNAAFQAWLKQVRRGVPLDPGSSSFASAHQMGSCRMGTSARRSVVDPAGRVWGTEGLYVADASVFPSASGVNPMITNMAISDWTSRKLAEEMAREKRAGSVRL